MDWLNYHHLLYFWVVAKEGTIRGASEQLHLAQPTVSAQIKRLEESVGEKLFERVGRNLILTETGQIAYRYAEEIFSLGRELTDVIRGRPTGRPLKLTIGAPEVIPKLIVHKMLLPALSLNQPVQIVCREGKLDQLLQDLAAHRLDMVISDTPIGPMTHIKAFNHLLGECAVSFFGPIDLAARLRDRFPASLEGAPVLLPTMQTGTRRTLEHWFNDHDIRPDIVAEFDDSALMKVFGQSGAGIFPGPAAIEDEICRQYRVKVIGRIDELKEKFLAITVERKLKHPAVVAISESAKKDIFHDG